MNYDDGQLLDQLRVALATAPARPDPIELAAFDRIVAEWREGTAPVGNAGTRARTGRLAKLHHPRLVAAGVVVATLGLGTGVAAAAGAPLTRGIREVAHDIGLPVQSPAVVDTSDAIDELRDALRRSDDAQVRAARDRLRSELHDLGGSDRASLRQRVDDVLQRADARLTSDSGSRPPAPTAGPPGVGPQGSTPRPPGTGTGDGTSAPGQHGSNATVDSGARSDDTAPPSPADTGAGQGGHSRDGQGDGGGPGPGAAPSPTTVAQHQPPSVDDSHGRGRGSRDATPTSTPTGD